MRTRRRASARWVVTLLAVAVLAITTGCGSGHRAQVYEPLTVGERFVAGDLASLPKPDGTVALAQPTAAGRTTTQSFKVVGSGADETFGFYEVHLRELGWGPQSVPEKTGHDGWRAVWIQDGRRLEIAASAYRGNGGSSQLDLVLTG